MYNIRFTDWTAVDFLLHVCTNVVYGVIYFLGQNSRLLERQIVADV
jgi:hypothetical protein